MMGKTDDILFVAVAFRFRYAICPALPLDFSLFFHFVRAELEKNERMDKKMMMVMLSN